MQCLDIFINIIPRFIPQFLAVHLLPDKPKLHTGLLANKLQERQNEDVVTSALTYISSSKENKLKKQSELK